MYFKANNVSSRKGIAKAVRLLGLTCCLSIFYCLKTEASPAPKPYFNINVGPVVLPADADSTIHGFVTDTAGLHLQGVSVLVKGTKLGTSTDINGGYLLAKVPSDAVLIFTMMGYQSVEVPVDGRSEIDVKLASSTSELEETVVVAFGTQKKKEMVGSVTSINVGDLKVPTSNLTTALAGRAAGLIAFQRSGEPGADNADFFVRGVTTFGYKKDPLILIDGVELTSQDLARLRPDDIESFSIMKDAASTALYGARGANGVIMVTTKRGKQGSASLSIRAENSFSSPTRDVEMADPVTYMKLENEAVLTRNPVGALPYSEDKIEHTANGDNPLIYPANDWYNMLFKKTALSQRANLNVSGGGAVARYFVSGSFTRDEGNLKVDKLNNFNNNIDVKRYTLRANVDVNLTKTTELSVLVSGNFDDYNGPTTSGVGTGGTQVYQMVMHSNPVLFPAYYPKTPETQYIRHTLFGNAGIAGDYLNPYAEMVRGYKDESRSFMSAQAGLKQDLRFFTKGLSFRSMVNIDRTSNFSLSRAYNPFWYSLAGYDKATGEFSLTELNPTGGTEYLGYSEGGRSLISTFYWENTLNYANTFNSVHNVGGTLVGTMRNTITPNGGTLQQSLPSRNTGLAGRFTYNYDDRYFAEFDFGYNGSERFYTNHRFGFFPSYGVAWTASNEKFFEPLKDVVTNLKLRATYGLVGNDAIGSATDRFFYLSNTDPNNAGRGATFGKDNGYYRPGYLISRYPNTDITWEKSYQQNYGLELSLFNKMNLTAEYYTSKRTNILMTRASIPTTMGLSADVRANVGEARSRGVDLSLDYSQAFNRDFLIKVMGNFTYAVGEFTKYEEPEYLENEWYRSRTGYSINQTWGYIAERLFTDDAEAANSPYQNFGEYGGGDIKYLDVNKDGQITGADMVPIGYPTAPEIVYGFGFSMTYKNFDISAFFQGLGHESFWLNVGDWNYGGNPGSTMPFDKNGALLKAYADSHWSEDNRDLYALWPRLSATINSNNTQTSTWFMRNGSFLRLKQLEVGYTMPGKWLDKIHLNTLRFYANASNLFTFSSFKMWDVEMAGNGMGYPLQRVLNVGVFMNFK